MKKSKKGVPVKYVSERLGHSSCKMTLDVYNSVMPSAKFGALDLLDSIEKNNEKSQKNRIKN